MYDNMNEKKSLDIKSMQIIFKQNRRYAFPIIASLICFILLFQFIIPQFNSLLAIKKEAKATSVKIATLKRNLNMLMNIDENSLDSQLKILNSALPLTKDFGSILNTLNRVAPNAGVSLGPFTLQIGDISKSESNTKFPMVKVSIPISAASAVSINNFVDALSKSLPLSEVSFIKTGTDASLVGVSFYYKELDYSGKMDDQINQISQKGLLLIDKLSGYANYEDDSSSAQ